MRLMCFYFGIVICTLQLSGCTAATSGVATIGVRIQFGDIKKRNLEQSNRVLINESEAYFIGTTFMCDHCGIPIPYKNAYPIPSKATTIGSFDYVEDTDKNKVYVMVEKERDFDIINRRGNGDYSIQRKYRLWYGYPAQLLQIVAVPVDVVLSIGQTTLFVAAYPFMR
jgi:hypothetical protein